MIAWVPFVLILIVALLPILPLLQRVRQLEKRVRILSKRLDMLASAGSQGLTAPALGFPPGFPPDAADRILALLRAGNKLAAIKLYRDATAVDLAEAKAMVEAIALANAVA